MGCSAGVGKSVLVDFLIEQAGAGRDCDRLRIERLVLLLPFHQTIMPFSSRSFSIFAVMLSSSLRERSPSLLQRITTVFFSKV